MYRANGDGRTNSSFFMNYISSCGYSLHLKALIVCKQLSNSLIAIFIKVERSRSHSLNVKVETKISSWNLLELVSYGNFDFFR